MTDIAMIDKELLALFAAKAIDADWSFADCKPSATTKWTHGYHRYPAKFIPQLVERLFDEYAPHQSATVNDPFMGSGTTIVSAIARGMRATGTDINQAAYLITKVKATPLEPNHLERKLADFFHRLDILNSAGSNCSLADNDLAGNDIEPLIPEKHLRRIDYWFTEENKLALGRILRLISREEDLALRDFLLVGFSHILKNTSIWMQSSTKPTRDLNKRPLNPYVALRRHIRKMQKGNAAFWEVVPPSVRRGVNERLAVAIGDARSQPVPDSSIDIVVTSSPYVTSYEYADLHQLSTIWLSLADHLGEYKREFIGTAYKSYENRELKSAIATRIVDEMREADRKMAGEIEAFFLDMEDVIAESHRILKSGGRACYVIGNTRLRGVDILNAEVFAEIMTKVGFSLDRIIKRQIPIKILPQTRDAKTGQFAKTSAADNHAYPIEYIVIGQK